jgi:hypothetical protein
MNPDESPLAAEAQANEPSIADHFRLQGLELSGAERIGTSPRDGTPPPRGSLVGGLFALDLE